MTAPDNALEPNIGIPPPWIVGWTYAAVMRALTALAGFALVVALTGCSDEDSGSSSDDTEPSPSATSVADSDAADLATAAEAAAGEAADPEADLEKAYRTYVEAFLTGDGSTAYGLLTKRCQDGTPLSEFAAISESAAEMYGDVDYEIKTVDVSGDRGTVDAEFPVAALNEGGGSEWFLEDGEWHSDKCD